MFRCEDPDLDTLWYNEVQKSFKRVHRQHNLTMRYKAELDMRRRADEHKVKQPLTYIDESSLIVDLMDGFESVNDTFVDVDSETDEGSDQDSTVADNPDNDSSGSGSECHDECSDVSSEMDMDDIPDIPLDLIDRLDDQLIEEFERMEIFDLFQLPCKPESRLSSRSHQKGNLCKGDECGCCSVKRDCKVEMVDMTKAFMASNPEEEQTIKFATDPENEQSPSFVLSRPQKWSNVSSTEAELVALEELEGECEEGNEPPNYTDLAYASKERENWKDTVSTEVETSKEVDGKNSVKISVVCMADRGLAALDIEWARRLPWYRTPGVHRIWI